jgi:NADPH:quinone reductase-like Zn-dependent oxidoreductase
MKAVICTRYGPPEVLRLTEVERPTPRRNQVRIRIFATAVTFSDCLARGLRVPRRYRLLFRLMAGWSAPRRNILGMVLAGDVESVGRNVRSFKEGDRVFGMSRWAVGAHAEEVCWSVKTLLAPKPANLSYDESAALPYGGLLAMHCLDKARLQPGQRVLI